MLIANIVSGGQSGADRAALDVAIEFGIPHGGWAPNGKPAEDIPIGNSDEYLAKYNLQRTKSKNVIQRTELNVIDSDATLIISHGPLSGGSKKTREFALRYHRPCLPIDLDSEPVADAVTRIVRWLISIRCATLNVAGPRASEDGRIYDGAHSLLEEVMSSQRRASSGADGRVDVAIAISQEAYHNFRHWDQIRWLVPLWFATITAGVVALLSIVWDKGVQDYKIAICSGLVAFAAFSLLCLLLLWNLRRYHIEHFDEVTGNLEALLPRGSSLNALIPRLPFSLGPPRRDGKRRARFWKTATFWFMIFISVVALVSLGGAFIIIRYY